MMLLLYVHSFVEAILTNLNVEGHGVRNKLADDLLQVGGGDLALDDVEHLLADLTDLQQIIKCQ